MASGKTIQEVIRRVLEVVQPEKIILFGSAARGEAGSQSDLDILVVASCEHRRRLAQQIYVNLIGVDVAVDVIVVKPEDLDRYRDSPSTVIEPALREGEVIYAA
jgi:predicted nucleotidyltransferase